MDYWLSAEETAGVGPGLGPVLELELVPELELAGADASATDKDPF
jgi:hypothetical protein